MDSTKLYGSTAAFTKAGLTGISGAATTFSTGATAIQHAIGGKAYSKTQVTGGVTPTMDAATGEAITLTAGQATVVVWALDSDSNVVALRGSVVELDEGDDFILYPEFPGVDLSTYCPFAYTIHKAGAALSGTFTFGSSNWNTGGMTHTVVDVSVLPSRPQAS